MLLGVLFKFMTSPQLFYESRSSSDTTKDGAWGRYLNYSVGDASISHSSKKVGFSVRASGINTPAWRQAGLTL